MNLVRKLILDNVDRIREAWNEHCGSSEPRIVSLEVTDDAIIAQLADGRMVSVPLAWSWRLAGTTLAQRGRFEIVGTGEGVHWPDVDEDISARGMLAGLPAWPPKPSKAKHRA